MKKRDFIKLFWFVVFVLSLTAPAWAQATDPAPPAPVDTGFLTQLLSLFSGKYGVVAQVLGLVAGLRVVFKPLMTWLDSAVKATPTTKDDQALAAVEASTAYKWVAWVLDYLTSIKIGPQANK